MHAALCVRAVRDEEVWSPPVPAAEEQDSHTEHHQEGEGEGRLERGGQVAHIPLGEGRGLQLVQLDFPETTKLIMTFEPQDPGLITTPN